MKRKTYLSIYMVIYLFLTVVLMNVEYKLIQFSSTAKDFAKNMYLPSGVASYLNVPLSMHLVVISLIILLVVWILNNYKELLQLYVSETVVTEEATQKDSKPRKTTTKTAKKSKVSKFKEDLKKELEENG